jgi:hypothetical protein
LRIYDFGHSFSFTKMIINAIKWMKSWFSCP